MDIWLLNFNAHLIFLVPIRLWFDKLDNYLIATCSIGAMQLVLMLVLVVCQDDSFASSCSLYVLLFHFLELLSIDCYEQVNLTVHQVGVDTTQFSTYKLLLAKLTMFFIFNQLGS